MTRRTRTAHPYRDTDVIDARAPRFNQATVGLVSLLAVLSGVWPLLALLALQLGVGLRFGRRYCLACVAYFAFVQPRFGEGPIEDSRPPKFANQVGLVVLSAASAAHLLGLATVGNALGLLVAGLASSPPSPASAPAARSTGSAPDCRAFAGARSIEWSSPSSVDLPSGWRVGELLVAFSHPLCTDCRDVIGELAAGIDPVGQRRCPRSAGPGTQVRRRPGADRRPGGPRRPCAAAGGRLSGTPRSDRVRPLRLVDDAGAHGVLHLRVRILVERARPRLRGPSAGGSHQSPASTVLGREVEGYLLLLRSHMGQRRGRQVVPRGVHEARLHEQ